MGIAIGSDKEMYQGVLVAPLSLLSPAPFEFGIPLYGLLFGVSIGLAGAPAGVKAFGEELHVFFREAAAGHSRIGYYIGKVCACVAQMHLCIEKVPRQTSFHNIIRLVPKESMVLMFFYRQYLCCGG